MHFDDYLGDWGQYHAFVYFLQFFPFFNTGALTLVFSFTGLTPENRCLLPRLDKSGIYELNNSIAARYEHYFLYQKDKKEPGYCAYCPDAVEAYKSRTFDTYLSKNNTCTPDRSKNCDEYLWKKTFMEDSMGMQWRMVCDEGAWKGELARSLTMIGYFIGAGTFGTLADRFGRKPIFLICSYTLILTANLVPVLPNFPTFCIFQIINGALSHGAFIIGFNIAMELISGLPGTICGIWVNGIFSIGILYVGMLTFFLSHWKHIHWATSAWTVVVLPYYWLLDESIRWLIVHNRTDEAEKLLIKASEINGKEVDKLRLREELNKEKSKNTQTNVPVFSLFKDWTLGRNTLIVFFTWAACSITYYGLSFNTHDIPGDPRVNFMISTVMEIPGCIVVIPMLQKLGRRITMATSIGVAGVAILMNVALTLGSVESHIPYIIFASLGRLSATGAFAVVYVYSAELFPTSVRNSSVGLSSMCARVGSSLSPQIHLLGKYTKPWVPSLIYGSMAVVAFGLDLILPETLNQPLPETIQDGIRLHRRGRGDVVDPNSARDKKYETQF